MALSTVLKRKTVSLATRIATTPVIRAIEGVGWAGYFF